MDRPVSTKDVPPQFLASAMLVGHVPSRTLPSEPRVSYRLYIPPDHYDTRAGASNKAKLPLLVYIHGSRRSVPLLARYSTPLTAFADSTPCAVLAPLFPTGMDGPNDLDSYKLLRSKTLRSDLALLAILDEVAYRWPGIDTDKVFMMGFSGGGQFAHRFLYLYSERIAAVSVGAPGRVTFFDDGKRWPSGVGDVERLFGRTIDKGKIRQVKIQLVVGDCDNEVHGGKEFWEWLGEMKKKVKSSKSLTIAASEGEKSVDGEHSQFDGAIQEEMRQGRLDTIRELQALWKETGIESTLEIVQGMGHDEGPASGIVLEYLGREMLRQ
jgi:poly(3-hydroxybutyrate) depolymerase